MKKGWAILSALTCLFATAPAYAATLPSGPSMFKTEIDVQGTVSSRPFAFAKNGTTYMPIWYVMQALDKLNVKTDWNGQDWKMTLPSGVQIDISKINPGTGSVHMYLNNTLVQKVNSIVAKDPSSQQNTTFLPIWYVMHTLELAKVVSGWNGKTWTLTQASTSIGSGNGTSSTAGGTGSSTGTGTGSTDGGTGSVTPTPPSIVVVPQPPLPVNEVAKYQYLSGLLPLMGISPDSTGDSPFDDIASTDPNWGYVHAAIENNLLTPLSSTHSGAYAAMTLSEADQIYWNALGMGNASYEPGGDPYDWANIIGLNPAGESGTSYISPSDEQAMFAQIQNFTRDYVQNGSTYHIVYPPEDEYSATFAGDVDGATGQPYFSSSADIQQAITKTYQFFDQTTFSISGSDIIITIPSTVNTNWFSYAATAGQIEYSIDGGATYKSTDVFDSRDLAGQGGIPSTILLKVDTENPVSLSFNQLLPSIGGTVSLGEMTITVNNGMISVVRNNLNS